MLLHERLSALMDQKGISVEALKNAADVTYEMARRYKLGIAEPRKEKLEKIADFLGVTPSWLQFGEGSSTNTLVITEDDEQESIVIDVLDVEASAGNGSTGDLVEVVSRLHYVPEQFYLYFRGVNPDNLRVINIRGDSMAPTFVSGDMIFVDIGTTCFDADGVYVFTYKDHLYVKRLQMAGDKLIVISDNPTYREWEINEGNFEHLHIHGKVKVHQSQQLNFIG